MMADERPEQPNAENGNPQSDPLISQEELDRAVAEAQEAARRAREASETAPTAPPRDSAVPDAESESLPLDFDAIAQDDFDRALEMLRRSSETSVPQTDHPAEETSASGPSDTGSTDQDKTDGLVRALQGDDSTRLAAESSKDHAGVGETPSEAEPAETSDLGQSMIGQEELDQAIAAAEALTERAREQARETPPPGAPSSPIPTDEGPLPPDLGVTSQDELDLSLQEHGEIPDAEGLADQSLEDAAAPPADEGETADQDEIDVMLKAVQQEHEPASEAPLSEAGSEQPAKDQPATPDEDVSRLDQDEINRILKSGNTASADETARPPDAQEFEEIDQDAVDRLIREAADQVAAQGQALSFDDSLGLDDETPPAPAADKTAKKADADATEQGDVDALLTSLSDGSGGEDKAPESPVPADQPPQPDTTSEDGDPLRQEDLDQVLAGPSEEELDSQELDEPLTEAAPDDTAAAEAETAKKADADATEQGDVDALLTSLSDASGGEDKAPESPVPADQPPQPDTTSEDGDPLRQEDLDQVLAGPSGEEPLDSQELDEPLTEAAPDDTAAAEAETAKKADADATEQGDVDALLTSLSDGSGGEDKAPESPVPADQPPQSETASEEEDELRQEDLDQVLAGPPGEELDSQELDEPLTEAAPDDTAAAEAETAKKADADATEQGDVDALLTSLSDGSGGEDKAPESPVPADQPPQPDTTSEDGDPLRQEDLDQVLAGPPGEEPLDGQELDEPLTEAAPDDTAAAEAETAKKADADATEQGDVDALLTSLSDGSGGEDKAPESPVPADQPPQSETASEEEDELRQEDLDQVLAGPSEEEPLDGQELDEPLTDAATDDAAAADAETAKAAKADVSAPEELPGVETSEVPEELHAQEDPVERAERGAAQSEVGSENLAAAAPQADDLLDSIIAEAESSDQKTAPPEEAPEGAAVTAAEALVEEITDEQSAEVRHQRDDMVVQLSDDELADLDLQKATSDEPQIEGAVRRDFRRSLRRDLRKQVRELARSGSLKTWTSIAAGILCTVGTFLFLQANQQRMPDLGLLSTLAPTDVEGVIRSAESLIEMNEFAEAESLLEPVVEGTQPGPNLAEAEYLYIKSRYRQLPSQITDQEAGALHKDIDDLVSLVPTFHRNPELLRWKAGVYERSGAWPAALSLYKDIIAEYTDSSGGDDTLIQAARLADRMKHPEESEEFLVKLLQRFPASPHAPEAKLLLGDALRDAGDIEDARRLYTQVAVGQDFSPIGVDAVARLAELEMSQGNYEQTIQDLEHRLETATTVEGNDAIYLLLAKAYQGNGDLDEAESILRELIGFFPESRHTAAAFVELSQTLDAKGNRREALRVATQASQRFPEYPEVLINEGELEQRNGNDNAAAERYLAAVDVGGNDPWTLLAAGNAFARVNELAKARRTLDRLLTEFPTAPEAFEGSITLAKVLQKQGQSQAALERLTNLSVASAGKPQQISLLLALGDLYNELGFPEHAAQQYENAAAGTNEATVLAKSAVALFEAGNAGPGLAIAHRVDPSELPPKLAYEFLSGYGNALLRMDTVMALEKMEQAYGQYPDQRTEGGDRALLNAYLVMGQMARARALVMDLFAYAPSHPDTGPRLQRTAILWADALFSRGDYVAAAQAYALAAEAAPEKEDVAWAKYQEANALIELHEYGKSLELLDTVAESNAPFAEDARLKAECARLEQRLRGEPVTAQAEG